MTQRVEVKGLRELQQRMKALNADMQKRLAARATGAGAAVIRKRARQLAPVAAEPYVYEGTKVDPGNIGKNIVAKKLPRSQTTLTSEHIVTVRGGRKHGYASAVGSLQEFGTVHHAAQPYMRPAFDQEKGFAVAAIKNRLAVGIERVAKGGKP